MCYIETCFTIKLCKDHLLKITDFKLKILADWPPSGAFARPLNTLWNVFRTIFFCVCPDKHFMCLSGQTYLVSGQTFYALVRTNIFLTFSCFKFFEKILFFTKMILKRSYKLPLVIRLICIPLALKPVHGKGVKKLNIQTDNKPNYNIDFWKCHKIRFPWDICYFETCFTWNYARTDYHLKIVHNKDIDRYFIKCQKIGFAFDSKSVLYLCNDSYYFQIVLSNIFRLILSNVISSNYWLGIYDNWPNFSKNSLNKW